MFCLRVSKLLSNNPYYTGKKCMDLLTKILKLAEVYITTDMNNLLGDPQKYASEILKAPFPMEVIIKKCFYDFITDEHLILNDAYNIDNDFVYSFGSKLPKALEVKQDYIDHMNKTQRDANDLIKHISLRYSTMF